ncbi:Carboxylic ester hydrolase [Aphelenchoides fujianensis]|nr:Carboxylic ester hydrolase [Aphelenchoides fujianensis]
MHRKGYVLLESNVNDNEEEEDQEEFIHFKTPGAERRKKRLFKYVVAFLAALLLLFLVYEMSGGSTADGPEIQLDVGRVRGKTLTLNDGFQMDVFYGLPFAEPPTGERRFEKPEPKKPWTGVFEATELKPLCFPIIGDPNDALFTEDCLHMNVYRPHKINSLLPIMFIVHGAPTRRELRAGTRKRKETGRKFVAKGMIVVAIQYRLAVLGFASTGDDELKGNFGYWDQAEALRFVHRNALAFGGDLDRITMFGCSAGGSSVGVLSICPHTRHMVHQAIMMSGSPFAAWTTSDKTVQKTRQLVEQLGLRDGESVKARLEASDDGRNLRRAAENRESSSSSTHSFRNAKFDDPQAVRREILEFYLKPKEGEVVNNVFYLQRYTQIFSDLQFTVAIARDISERKARGWPIHAYMTTYVNPGAVGETCPIKKSFHGADQRYLILGEVDVLRFEKNADDFAMESLLVDTRPESLEFAALQPKPEMRAHLFADRLAFWSKLAADHGFDLVRGLPSEQKNKP